MKGKLPPSFFLAWRELSQNRTRTALSACAVALGVALTLATDLLSGALLNVFNESELARTFGQGLFDQLARTLNVIGAVIILAAGFLVYNAFGMSITQRKQHIGALRALGMTRGQVIRWVLVEGGITALIGVGIGFVVGPWLGRGIIWGLQNLELFINQFAESSLSPGAILLASVLGFGVTLFAVMSPARRAARVTPLEALREKGGALETKPGPKRWLWGAAIWIGVAGFLAVAPPARWVSAPVDLWLTAGFVGAWLIGAGLLLPGVIGGVGGAARAVVKAFPRRFGAVGRLASDNLLRDRGRVTTTTSTLLIAVALVVGMTGFMAFMMDTLMFRTIDELTSHPGWTVMTVDVAQGTSVYTEATLLPREKKDAFYAAFRDRANIAEFNFVIVPELSFLGDTYFSFVLDPYVVRATGDTFFSFSEGSWDTALPLMEAGCGVLLPQFTASKIGVGLGETFPVTGQNGPVTCTVAGIGSSFVLASIIGDAVKEQFAVGEPFSLYLSPQFGVEAAQLEQDIFALAQDVSLNVTTIAGFAEPMQEAFGQIKVMFNGMLLLAMITAALAVVNTTAMSVAERRRELGLLRAVGAKRSQITALITLEAGWIGLIGGAMGLVTGVGFAMIVVLVYGGNSWGFTDMLPWPTAWQVAQPAWMTGALGVITAPFVAALAAWWPARALVQGTAIETLTPPA